MVPANKPARDYYRILGLSAAATPAEVRKAYRQLAMKYHPDKNNDDPSATANFRQVLEAYQVLSDPQARAAYNQQRWFRRRSHKESAEEVFSPEQYYRKVLRLARYVKSLGEFRVDEQALYLYMMQLLGSESIRPLLAGSSGSIRSDTLKEFLKAAKPLSFSYIKKLEAQLLLLAADDKEMITDIRKEVRQRKWLSYWQKYQGILILLVALVLCWLIYKAGN